MTTANTTLALTVRCPNEKCRAREGVRCPTHAGYHGVRLESAREWAAKQVKTTTIGGVKREYVDTTHVCPFCEQNITVTTDERGSYTECGGEGEGSCSGAQVADNDSQTARAHDAAKASVKGGAQ